MNGFQQNFNVELFVKEMLKIIVFSAIRYHWLDFSSDFSFVYMFFNHYHAALPN